MSIKKVPVTKIEIAESLSISPSTLRRWLIRERIEVPRGLISPNKVFEIYHKLGYAGKAEEFRRMHNFTPITYNDLLRTELNSKDSK
jgi:hypothetical protein